MRRKIISSLAGIIVGLVLACAVLAQEGAFQLNPQFGMKELLTVKIGSRVAVRTDAGETLEGTVVKVGDHLLHLSKIAGKDFYDAVIRIDRITSLVMKVR
jgi:hypothetical protein